MQNLFIKIAGGVVAFGLGISALFGHPAAPNLGATLPIAGSTYTLAGSGVSSSDTSITLQSFTITQTGQPILTANLSQPFFITLEPGNRTKQEIIACTAVNQNGNGTATISGCARGMAPISPYTASTTLAFVHAGGSQVIFSDPPQHFNQYAALANTELISGQWTASSSNPLAYDQAWGESASSTSLKIPYVSWIYNNFADLYSNETVGGNKTFSGATTFASLPQSLATPLNNADLTTKTYVDGVAVAGAANANTTTKGIVQEATLAQIRAGTASGSTGAELYVNPAQFKFASSTIQLVSTTTTANLSTSTLYGIPFGKDTSVTIRVASTTDSGLAIWFNDETGGFGGSSLASGYSFCSNAGDGNTSTCVGGSPVASFIRLSTPGDETNSAIYIKLSFANSTSSNKLGTGTVEAVGLGPSTSNFENAIGTFGFSWASSTAAIHSISIAPTYDPALPFPKNNIFAGSYMEAAATDPIN